MTGQKIHTEMLVELYGMAKMYAEDESITDRQREAILYAETLIENNTGWEVTEPFEDEQ